MFLNVEKPPSNPEGSLLINLQSVVKIAARQLPKPEDTMKDWEVIVCYRDERRFNPIPVRSDNEPTWVGTFETIRIDSVDACHTLVSNIYRAILRGDKGLSI